ncbi:methyltransferase [Apodospora peruviana]|uniref:Methyltransferase n=1 Tax=Apodospora peruviana TaxID=516989 RepID=A0AAE0HVT4_9PEZI|nr:methyltransferase [Apodospora peruviana]
MVDNNNSNVTVTTADMKARLKESYDTIAPTYNTWTTSHSSLRIKYLDKLLQLLLGDDFSPGRTFRVLELGCGAGIPVTESLLHYPTAHFHITANDLSSTQIALGKERLGGRDVTITELASECRDEGGSKVNWVQGDMMALSFSEGEKFDLVIGLYSLIHLPRDEQEVMVDRIAGWLRPDTGLMLVNFSEEEMPSHVSEGWLGEEKGWMYWSGWGAEKMEEKIGNKKLEVLVSEVNNELDDGIDASFLWVIARAT